MTARFTNAEWTAIIQQTEKDLAISQEPYPCPEIGSPDFMKTIDHTLLKLEARSAQFDDLCAEARVDGFAVCDNKVLVALVVVRYPIHFLSWRYCT